MRQAKANQPKNRNRFTRKVSCAKCGTLTEAYRPTVIMNRPVWVCATDCKEV